MKVIVHSSDISSPTLDFEDFVSQGLRINQEFHDQY